MIQAGVARRDITPPVGTVLMGYAPRRSERIHDRLSAAALILESGTERTALLSITTTVIDDYEVARIRQAVHQASGIDLLRITVAACQIHSGPATQTCYGWDDRNDTYCREILEPGAAEAAKQALGQLQPAYIGVASGFSDVGINRREIHEEGAVMLGQNPWGPYDPEMTAIRLVDGSAKTIANIIHYGAHPTATGATGDITRDWPGVMIDRSEALFGGITLFLNGAVGDVGPRLSNGRTTGDLAQMLEVGNRAAYDAVRVLRSIREYRELDLEILTDRIRLPYQPLPTREQARENLAQAEANKDQIGLGMATYSYWQRVIQEYEQNSVREEKVIEQTLVRLGPIVLVPFTGEPFAEIVLRLRKHSPFRYTLPLSTTNGCDGYFVTRDSLHRRGYEVEVAKAFSAYILAENIDDVLVRENLRLIRRLKKIP